MARAASKKAKTNESPGGSSGGAGGSKGNGSILSFFARTPSDSVANGNGAASGTAAGAGRRASGSSGYDVKPDVAGIERKTSRSSRNGIKKATSSAPVTARADGGHGGGSKDDPMVISDEEDLVEVEPAEPAEPARMEAASRRSARSVFCKGSEAAARPAAAGEVPRPKMPVGKSEFGEWDTEIVIADDAPGPSTPRSRSGQRSTSSGGQSDPREQSCSPAPPPFAGMPDFKPPPSWPQIVNTASAAEEDEDGDIDMDERPSPGALEANQSIAQDDEEDVRGVGDDDDDSIADRSEGSHDHDHDPGDDDPVPHCGQDGASKEPVVIPEATVETPNADPVDSMQDGFAGLDMEWGDDADEGMGMDDFGEEEGLDLDEPAAGVLGKRKDKKGAKASAGRGKGKGRFGGANMERCPVCDRDMKGKSDAIVQKHINSCLDSPNARAGRSGGSAFTHKAAGKSRSRPISSFAPQSPAPSPSPSPEPLDMGTSAGNGAGRGPNAFSVLMSGHKEREQWKDAEIDLKRDGKRTFGRRKAPFYKVMTGMPVAVDAFRYGAIPKVTAYLLTHAHSDHYTNLSKSWTHGPIYCSQTTANLIVHMLGVEPQWVHGLPDNVPFVMPNTGGVKVTPIEANHCPGSSIFLFEGPQTVNAGDSGFKSPYVGSKRTFRYLHCGDFRACPKMVLHPEIARARIDTCYLDTTYLNPKYCFPPQPQVIEACAQLARKTVLGLPDDAPPLKEVKLPVFDLIKAEPGTGAAAASGVRQEPGNEVGEQGDKAAGAAVKYEPGLADIQAEERGKAMMKGWLVNVKDEEGVKAEPDTAGEGIVKREEGEDLVSVDGTYGAIATGIDGKPAVDVKPNVPPAQPKKKGRTLVVMGTYSIGKERIVKAVAQALGTTIYCDPRKRGILLCETDPDLHALLSTDPVASHVHLLPLGNIQLDRMQEYLTRLHPHFDRVLGFRPTGWSYSPPAGTDLMPDVNAVIRRDQARWFTDASLKPMRGSCRQYMMYGVPYSEHSSFFELSCFALSMPGPDLRMIATVNVGNEKSRAKMKKWFEKWLAEKARRKEKNLPAVVDYRDITYVFYAVFDPKLGPTVIHQVPEDLITSSGSTDDATNRSRSRSRSQSGRASLRGSADGGGHHHVNGGGRSGSGSHSHGLSQAGSTSRSHSRTRVGPPAEHADSNAAPNGGNSVSMSRASSIASASVSRDRTPSPSRSIARTFSIEPAALASARRGSIPLLNFALISDYVIPKKALVGKLVSFLTTGRDERQTEYRVMGFPCVLSGEGGKYVRNEYMWNLCFVFEANCSLEAFEPVVRKCARILRSAEIDSAYLSGPNPNHTSLPAVLEQLFEDLNSYSETSIPLDGFNSLEVKLFPFYPNPPECEDWHVPIALVDFAALKDDNWDITAARVSQHIDGVNHVGRIAHLADADPALVRETLRHMLFYQVIMVVDIFQYSNMYTLKPSITKLVSDDSITLECANYAVRKGYPKPSWPNLLRLYAKLHTGLTVHKWIEANGVLSMGIDPRRFVSFGIIKGFLRRVHRYPIMLERKTPLLAQYTGVIDYGGMNIGHPHGSGSALGLGPGGHRRRVEFKAQLGSATTLSVSTRPGDSAFLQRSGPGDSSFTVRSSEGGAHSHSHAHTQSQTPQSQSNSHSQSHSTLPTSAVESSPGAHGPGNMPMPMTMPGRTPPGLSNLGRSPGNAGAGRRTVGLTALREGSGTAVPLAATRHRDSGRPYRDRERSDGDYYASGYARTAGMPSDTSIPQITGTGSARASAGGAAGASGFVTGRSRRTNLKGPAARAKEANERRFEDDLIGYLDGTHHADEIQVKFGLGWNQLESILGLGELKDGKGRKGVALIYR